MRIVSSFIISFLSFYFFGKDGLNVLVFFFCTYLRSVRWFVQFTFYVIGKDETSGLLFHSLSFYQHFLT